MPGTFTYEPPDGSVLPVGQQILLAHFEPTDPSRWQPSDIAVRISVLPLPTEASWDQPAPIPFGTPLGPDQLNATASVVGTWTYTPPAGTILQPGPGQVLTANFTAPNHEAGHPDPDDRRIAGSR